MKNSTGVTLNLLSNVVSDSNGENNFPHKLLLTDAQVSRLCKAFANGSSANIKLSESQRSKMVQSGGFPDPFLLQANPKFGELVVEINRRFACRKS